MNSTPWVLASNNENKLQEINDLLQDSSMVCEAQSIFGVPEADEPFATFVENALHKARHASRYTGLPALADDSGLCVSFLGGQPGVLSARFAGVQKSSQDNINKLLRLMTHQLEREAFFYCVLVLVRHADDPCPIIAEGIWQGLIAPQPSGTGGFGYDSVFYLPKHNATVAELPQAIKRQDSHRAQALRSLLERVRLDTVL
jgi:XTP/dITP diphosphohydrolase